MLCDRCNERDARVFMTTVLDGISTQRKLCEECSEVENPGWAAAAATRSKAGCLYCGAKAEGSVCPECRKKLQWFMKLEEFTFPHEAPTPELAKKLAADWHEVMVHMRAWVAKGKPDRAE